MPFATIAAIVSLVISVASAAYSMIQAKKMRDKAKKAADARKGYEMPVEGQAISLPVIYGRAKIGGARVYHNTTGNYVYPGATNADMVFSTGYAAGQLNNVTFRGRTGQNYTVFSPSANALNSSRSGKKNGFLYIQQALCQAPIEAVWDVIVDESRMLDDPSLGTDQYRTNSPELEAALRIDCHYSGSEYDQVISANLGERRTATFDDMVYMSAVVLLDRDNPQFAGTPIFQALVEGKKVRTVVGGVLQGTYAYSNNPAWCLLDYLLDPISGKGLSTDDIDLDSFEAGAAICDTVVATGKPTAGHIWRSVGDGTRFVQTRDIPLYECNFVVDTNRSIRENIEGILATMGDARLVWSQGRYKLSMQYPANNAAIVVSKTLTDDDIVSGEDAEMSWPTASERLNHCIVKFSNEAEDFKEDTASWPPKLGHRYGDPPKGEVVSLVGIGASRYSIGVSSKGWDEVWDSAVLLNNYSVWAGNAYTTQLEYFVIIPREQGSSTATIEFAADDHGSYTIQEWDVATQSLTGPVITQAETSNRKTKYTKTNQTIGDPAQLVDKAYKIVINATDDSGQTDKDEGSKAASRGVALRILQGNLIIWNTREPRYQNIVERTQDDTVYISYLSADGGVELETELYAEGITDYYHALAKAEELVRTSRGSFGLKLRYRITDGILEPGDFVLVNSSTLSLNNVYFRVNDVKVSDDFTAELEMSRFDASFLAWNVDDWAVSQPPPVFDDVVPVPEWLEFVPNTTINADGEFQSSGVLNWPHVRFSNFASYILYVHVLGYDTVDSVTGEPYFREIGRTRSNSFVVPAITAETAAVNSSGVYFAIRSISASGKMSTYNYSNITAGNADEFVVIEPVFPGTPWDSLLGGNLLVTLSNEAHTVPADSDGGNPDMTGSGTAIRVYEGSTALEYVAGTPGSGQWTVSAAGTAISPSSPSDMGTYAEYGDHTGMSSNTASIDYTISGYTSYGYPISFVRTQSFSKSLAGADGSPAKVLRVIANKQIFTVDSAGNYDPDPQVIQFSTSKQNTTATVNWSTSPSVTLYDAPTGGSATTTGDTVYLRSSAMGANATVEVTGSVTDGGTFSDKVGVVKVADGADGQDGIPGYNTAVVSVYKRAAAQPTDTPTNGSNSIVYTFADQSWSPGYPANGWSTGIPNSDGNPCWVRAQVAFSNTSTDTFTDAGWSTATKVVEDGADGSPAQYVVVTGQQAFRYQDGASVPDGAAFVTLSAQLYGGLSGYDWEYHNGSVWTNLTSRANTGQTYDLYHNDSEFSGSSIRVRCVSGSFNDEITVVKLYDGADGTSGVSARYPTIYRLNSSSINATSGTFADPLSGNPSWSYSVPTMTADGDQVFASSRIFTSDGLAPQQASWSTPAVYAERQDGVDGSTGQGIRQVNLYKLNDNTLASNTFGTFADPKSGAEAGWDYAVPGLTANGDIVYTTTRTFTSDGQSPQTATWTAPVEYSRRQDGTDGTGADAVTALLTNDSVGIPVDNAGANPVFTNSGTEIRVYEGVTALDYDGAGTSNGTWTVSETGSSVTPDASSPTSGGSTPSRYAVYGDIDGIAADVGYVTYAISGKLSDGTAFGPIYKRNNYYKAYAGPQGEAGTAVNTRYPTIYRLNNNTISSTSGTFADPLSGNTSWSYSVPTMTADGDVVYAASRIFTSDGNAPQEANWSTPAVYASRVDGESVQGPAGQSARQVNLYKLNDSTLTTNTFGTYADPLNGAEAGWGYDVPSLVSDGDTVYVTTRTFTSDGNAPQDATWSTPSIYSVRYDGNDAVDTRYPTIYRLNSSSINSASGTFADPLSGNPDWSYAVPTMTADGDVVYASSRRFTSNGAAPQDASWSTPAVYATRQDGADGGTGPQGQSARTVNLYKLNDATLGTPTAGTFADPLSGMEAGWGYSVPSLAADGDVVYVVVRTFTSDAQSPQDASWAGPNVYARRVDGSAAINSRYPTIYRLNSSSINSTSGTFADPLSGNTSWSYGVPTMTADGDVVYASSRIFTSDGSAPQQSSWSTPAVYARRTDGQTGDTGQSIRQVNLYKLNDATLGTPAAGTHADPLSGMEAGWGYNVPSLAADSDKVYVITRTLTSDGAAPQDASWAGPYVYSQRTDGQTAAVYYLDLSSPVIFKEAPDAATDGVHTNITVSGKRSLGQTVSAFGYVTVTGSGQTESGTAQASITTSIANGADRSYYTCKLYDGTNTATANLLDTQVVPVVFKGATGASGGAGLSAVLSNESHTVPANADGSSPILTNSRTDIRVYEGGAELAYTGSSTTNGQYAVSRAASSGITMGNLLDSGQYATSQDLVGMTPDSGYIDFTISGKTSAGVSFSLVKRQSFAKSKTGSTGADSTSYWLSVSHPVVTQDPISKAYTPASITLAGFSKTGAAGPAAYAGRFKVYENGSGTPSYTSSGDEYTKVYTPSGDAVASVKVELWSSGGATKLDEETTPVISENLSGNAGDNLIRNGGAELASNYNFPTFSYVASGGVNDGAYFSKNSTPDAGTNLTDEHIVVDTAELYEFKMSLKLISAVGGTQGRGLFGLGCYTAAGQFIGFQNCWRHATTDTTVYNCTQGNTHMDVYPVPGMSIATFRTTVGTSSVYAHFGIQPDFSDLPNFDLHSFGNLLPNGTGGVYVEDFGTYWRIFGTGAISATRPQGSAVGFGYGGSTWTYVIDTGYSDPLYGTSWTSYRKFVGGVNGPNSAPSATQFRRGTAYVRVYLRQGYQSDATSLTVGYDNMAFRRRDPQLTGYLTNPTATLPASENGTVTDYSGASGTFKVFLDAEDVTADAVFTVVANTGGLAPTAVSGGAYAITSGLDADTEEITWRATYTRGAFTAYVDQTFTLTRSKQGATGDDGLQTAVVYLYKRSSTESAADIATSTTYTFSSKQLSPSPVDGWSQTMPAFSGYDPYLWVIAATALETGPGTDTDTILSSEWSDPATLSKEPVNTWFDWATYGPATWVQTDKGLYKIHTSSGWDSVIRTKYALRNGAGAAFVIGPYGDDGDMVFGLKGTYGGPTVIDYGWHTYGTVASPRNIGGDIGSTTANSEGTILAVEYRNDGTVTWYKNGVQHHQVTGQPAGLELSVEVHAWQSYANSAFLTSVTFWPVASPGETGQRGPGKYAAASGASGPGYAISNADVDSWYGTLTTGVAIEAAAFVIANSSNGWIEQGDQLMMYYSGKSATRIFTAARTNNSAAVNAGSWSSRVVETIDGSLIVTGTILGSHLQATTLSAIKADMGTITSGVIRLDSGGWIGSAKTGYGQATSGWFIGYQSGPKVDIGNSAKYLRWDGNNLLIGGDIIATGNIQAGAVTTENQAVGGARTLTFDGAQYDMVSCAITVVSGRGVKVLCQVSGTNRWYYNDGYNDPITVDGAMYFKLYRGTTLIRTFSYSGDCNGANFFIDVPGAGTFTYKVAVQFSNLSPSSYTWYSAGCGDCYLHVEQLKR